MNPLYPHFIIQMQENNLPLDCGYSSRFNQEDPFFLARCEPALTHEDHHHHHPHPEYENHKLYRPIDQLHSSNKVSLRRQKEKTSIKHLDHQKSTLLHLTHKKQHENRPEKTANGAHTGQERRNAENLSIRHSLEYPLPTLPQNLLQNSKHQQLEPDHKIKLNSQARAIRVQVIDSQHLEAPPKIHFNFQSTRGPLSRCRSQKLLSLNSPCPSSRTHKKSELNLHSERTSHQDKEEQENVEIQEHLSFHKKKDFKTKLSYETNCSDSQHHDEILHFVSEDIIELMDSHLKNGKKSLKGTTDKSHRGFNHMTELYEVKSVMDQSERDSDGESIVLGKLMESDGLKIFTDFCEPEEESFVAKRRVALKNF